MQLPTGTTLIAGAFGRKGSGKTSVIRSLAKREKRQLVWDPFREHAVVWIDDGIPALCEYLAGRDQFRVGIDDADPESALAMLRISEQLTHCTVILEEVDLVGTPISVPIDLRRAIAQGRHWDLNLLYTSRRPAEVPRLLTSQSDAIYIFNTHEPRDVQHLRSYLRDLADTVQTLPKFHGYHWKADGSIARCQVDPGRAVITDTPLIAGVSAETIPPDIPPENPDPEPTENPA